MRGIKTSATPRPVGRPMVRRTVELDEELYLAMHRQANLAGSNMSEVIRAALRTYLGIGEVR